MQAAAQKNEAEAEEAQRKFEEAQKQVEKLKAQLEVQGTSVRASHKVINYIQLDCVNAPSYYRKGDPRMKLPKTRLPMRSP